jgi:hypothetical protein
MALAQRKPLRLAHPRSLFGFYPMEAKYSDFLDIGDNAEEVREYMRDLSTKYYNRR